MEHLWGVMFENLLFHLGVGDIKNSSLICSITCLFHRFEIKRGTIFRSADVNFFRWKVNYPSHYERLPYKFLLYHTHNIWTREKEKILVWLVIIKLYLTERQFQAINIVVPTMFLPFYYSGFISLTVLTKLQMCKAMNFNLKVSLTYDGNPYNLTHKPTF